MEPGPYFVGGIGESELDGAKVYCSLDCTAKYIASRLGRRICYFIYQRKGVLQRMLQRVVVSIQVAPK